MRPKSDHFINLTISDIVDQNIQLKSCCSIHLVKLNTILYFKTTEKITNVYITGSKTFIVDESLSELEKRLPSALFFRINRQIIINLFFIDKIKLNNSANIFLNTGEKFILSRRRKEKFLTNLR